MSRAVAAAIPVVGSRLRVIPTVAGRLGTALGRGIESTDRYSRHRLRQAIAVFSRAGGLIIGVTVVSTFSATRVYFSEQFPTALRGRGHILGGVDRMAAAGLSEPRRASVARCHRTVLATTPISGIDTSALAESARASKLTGSKVYKGDTSIGQIEDAMVSLDQATVTAVILSVGGFLGIGDKLVAVSVKQIRVGPEVRFITDLTKEQLANAPAFDFARLE